MSAYCTQTWTFEIESVYTFYGLFYFILYVNLFEIANYANQGFLKDFVFKKCAQFLSALSLAGPWNLEL